MESVTDNAPLVVILGQTASGKTGLSLALAQQFNGEIIAADSRTIYRGIDIATAKPTPTEQHKIRHHLLNIVMPNQLFSAADFQQLAREAMADIAARGKLAFMVGGSGLYIDAVAYDFSFRQPPDEAQRAKLEKLSVEDLQSLLTEQGIPLPVNQRNPRHLIRSLETGGALSQRKTLRPNTILIGLDLEKEQLAAHIRERVEHMFAAGLLQEMSDLAERYGWEAPGLQVPGLAAVRAYSAGEIDENQAKQLFVTAHLQFAKRQKTWFKRDKNISWISKSEEAVELITTLLNK